MLTLVATPIGNLQDISLRAIQALRDADCILCEDTRHSKILLNAHDIDCPLLSYHLLNESKRLNEILDRLQKGETLCMISDAGTPGICDPGQRLIDACHASNIPVSIVPGPCAFASALAVCGFEYERAQFGGFLPKKEGERKRTLIAALAYPGVSVFYETPHQISKTLSELNELGSSRQLCIVRELTKQFEEVVRGTADELKNTTLKGEFCLVISHCVMPFESEGLVQGLMKSFDLPAKEAIKIAADLCGLDKRELYRDWHT